MKQALKICIEAMWGLMTMVIILGGIMSGVFTANESASIAVIWAFFVTMFIYRDYKWRDLPKLVHRTVKTVTTLTNNTYLILFYINIMLLILGTLMDMAPLILILTPILLPVVKTLGVDPVHFGIIIRVNLGIGFLTPPVGSVLVVGSAVGKLSIEKLVNAMYPFFFGVLLLLLLAMVTYWPALTLWLPGSMLK